MALTTLNPQAPRELVRFCCRGSNSFGKIPKLRRASSMTERKDLTHGADARVSDKLKSDNFSCLTGNDDMTHDNAIRNPGTNSTHPTCMWRLVTAKELYQAATNQPQIETTRLMANLAHSADSLIKWSSEDKHSFKNSLLDKDC